MSRDDMSESDPWKEILPVLQWHYGTVKWRPRVDGRWNCCSEMFSLGYWWIVSQCNTPGYVWIYILYSYMKGFGQVRFNFDDIWQRVNFVAQRVSEQTGKLSGGPRVFDPRVRQIFRASVQLFRCLSKSTGWAIIEELSIRRRVSTFLISWGQKTCEKHCYVD